MEKLANIPLKHSSYAFLETKGFLSITLTYITSLHKQNKL
uniref:Uncharacterized protein n=1 Tax=Rhizophora mucronata TaxID=61149 RepID=A0A2P2IY51_RHIMU